MSPPLLNPSSENAKNSRRISRRMSLFRRKSLASVRPSITWPLESRRAPISPTPAGPITHGQMLYLSDASSTRSSTQSASTTPTSPGMPSFPAVWDIHSLENHSQLPSPTEPNSFSSNDLIYDLYSSELPSNSCEVECADDLADKFAAEIKLSDEPPSREAWEEAGNIPIFDQTGNSRPFRTLFEGDLAIGEQQVVIFVRHFFCGACQGYLRSLSKSLSLEAYFSLPVPSSITIIGLGSPQLIPQYRAYTNCPFPIYTDQSRRLYKLLGMTWTLNPGKRVEYMDHCNEYQWLRGQFRQFAETDPKLRFKGGHLLWCGGEFMIQHGRVTWCRRMRNFRGHSDIATLKRLLGAEE